MQDNNYWTPRAKFNSFLLLILIILMIFAIRIMKQNKEMYLGVWQPEVPTTGQVTTINNPKEPNPQPKPTVQPVDLSSVIAKIKAKDNGPLSECKLNGSTYFFANDSVFDGKDKIYDANGELLATCGGGRVPNPNPLPQICTDLRESGQCKDIQ